MEIRIDGDRTGARKLGIAVAGLAIALALVDFVVLRGERVAAGSAPLSGDRPAVLELAATGEEHLIEITTRRHRQGETMGRSVDYRLVDPDGNVLVEESEIVSREKRYLTIDPAVPGAYRLFVEDEGLLGSSSGSARVAVYRDDHRISRRFSF